MDQHGERGDAAQPVEGSDALAGVDGIGQSSTFSKQRDVISPM